MYLFDKWVKNIISYLSKEKTIYNFKAREMDKRISDFKSELRNVFFSDQKENIFFFVKLYPNGGKTMRASISCHKHAENVSCMFNKTTVTE